MELFPHLRRTGRRWLTPAGRIALVGGLVAGGVGADPINSQVHLLFTILLGMAAATLLFGPWWAPRRRRTAVTWQVPPRVVCKGRVPVTVTVTNRHRAPLWDLEVAVTELPRSFHADEALTERVGCLPPGETLVVQRSFTATRRGSYPITPPAVATTFPFGLVRFGFLLPRQRPLLVTPEVHPIVRLSLAPGMRYQVGGIPLASATGESLELMGVREYRPGDNIRRIHWKLWARRGIPVVKEFQQEYFSRVALILDTFLPARARPGQLEAFEAAVSAAASLASAISLQESVLDLFAAGPEVYFMTVGRNLGFIQNVLDVLACVEPCREPPFQKLEAAIGEHLGRVTAVLLVLVDLDEPRLRFLRQVRQTGVWVKLLLVRAGAPTIAPSSHPDLFDDCRQVHPATLGDDLREA